jgi:hypothetical protein
VPLQPQLQVEQSKGGVTHWLFVHTCVPPQLPQEMLPPHPSGMLSQFAPAAAQVLRVQQAWL